MDKLLTIIGTLPPVTGISPYCIGLLRTLKNKQVTFESIKSPYPNQLYPGTLYDQSSLILLKAIPQSTTIRNDLVWWNPIGWLKTGLRINTPEVYLNWWTIALFPMLFTIALIARLRGKHVVGIIHNPTGHERYPVDRYLTKLFLKTCQRFFIFNQKAADSLVSRYQVNRQQLLVKEHPPLDFYPNQEITKEEARKQLNLPQQAKIYLYFGRIRRYKNLNQIVQSFSQVVQKDQQSFLVIAGEAWISLADLKKLIAKLKLKDKIRLLNKYIPTDEVSRFFRATDVFIFAHQDQGSGSGVKMLAKNYNLPIVCLTNRES